MNRRGAVLLEAVIALAMISIAALSTVGQLQALSQSLDRARMREAESQSAEQMLMATALLTREELEARIGVRELTPFLIRVARPTPDLFRVSVSPTDAAVLELLVTLVYRPVEDER